MLIHDSSQDTLTHKIPLSPILSSNFTLISMDLELSRYNNHIQPELISISNLSCRVFFPCKLGHPRRFLEYNSNFYFMFLLVFSLSSVPLSSVPMYALDSIFSALFYLFKPFHTQLSSYLLEESLLYIA